MTLSLLQDINTLGTLILAAIAVAAIIIPLLVSRYQRPIFSIDLYGINYTDVPPTPPEIRIAVTNSGIQPAHGCKVLVDIGDNKGKKIGSMYLPWMWKDPSKFRSVPPNSDAEEGGYDPYADVTYVPIDIFPHETVSTKFIFWPEYYYGSLETSFIAIFGATKTYYYYPKWKKGELVTTPYLSEYFPPLALPPEYGDGTYLEPDTTYSATITVFSDEHSYIKLKKFYFKFGKPDRLFYYSNPMNGDG